MPLPLLLLGGAAALGGTGLFKGNQGRLSYKEAGRIRDDAKENVDRQIELLEAEREATAASLAALGQLKLDIYDIEIRAFADAFGQIKNVDVAELTSSDGPIVDQIAEHDWAQIDFGAIDALKATLAGLGAGGAAGAAAWSAAVGFGAASTGTAIASLGGAAATNATLAFFGGGALAAGGGGIALGTTVLGGVVAAPVLAAMGLVVSAKGRAALEDAKADAAQAEQTVAEMRLMTTVSEAIRQRSETARTVLIGLRPRFQNMLRELNRQVTVNADYASFDEAEREALHVTVLTAITVRQVLDTSLVSETGELTPESRDALAAASELKAELGAGH